MHIASLYLILNIYHRGTGGWEPSTPMLCHYCSAIRDRAHTGSSLLVIASSLAEFATFSRVDFILLESLDAYWSRLFIFAFAPHFLYLFSRVSSFRRVARATLDYYYSYIFAGAHFTEPIQHVYDGQGYLLAWFLFAYIAFLDFRASWPRHTTYFSRNTLKEDGHI